MPTIEYKNKSGKRVSGVTTIIGANLGWNKEQLMWWANSMGLEGKKHRDVSQKAADSGTVAHYLIECDIKGEAPDMSKYPADIISKAETAYLNFLEWKDMVKFIPIAIEPHLVSETYQFGLTPDCIAEIKSQLALFDWKTGSGVYEDMLIQIAAYKVGWEENNPDKLLDGGFHLLRINKEDASFSHHWWQALPDGWEAFKHCLELHELHKRLKKAA